MSLYIDKITEEKLLGAAKKAMANAYAPYSAFKVGAAILAENGEIYSGCNFENSSFGAGTCAERVALGSAIAAGQKNFKSILIIADADSIIPCGICRQTLSEFGDFEVICKSRKDTKKYMLSELLPESFKLK